MEGQSWTQFQRPKTLGILAMGSRGVGRAVSESLCYREVTLVAQRGL